MNETLKAINTAILKDSTNPTLWVKRSKYYLENGQIEEALESLEKATTLDSLNFDALDHLADIYLLAGRLIDCEDALYRLIKLDPQNISTLLKLSKYYLVTQNWDESKRYAKKVLEIDKRNAQAFYVIGTDFVEEGDTSKALSYLIRSVEQDPNFYDAQLQLAIIYETRSNPLAAEYYRNAIRIRPKHLPTQYALGYFLQEKSHQISQAITVYNTILQQDSSFFKALYNLGYIYLVYQNQPRKALEYFEKVIDLIPSYADAYYNAGYCHELLKNKPEAIHHYKTALSLNPDYELTKKRLQALQ